MCDHTQGSFADGLASAMRLRWAYARAGASRGLVDLEEGELAEAAKAIKVAGGRGLPEGITGGVSGF